MRGPKLGATADAEATQSGPTRPDALPSSGATWHSQPALAFAVRALLFIAPIVAGWFAVRTLAPYFWRPEGGVGWVLWVVQAIVIALGTSMLVERGLRRFVPLTSLLGMTLLFPDKAPSRYRVAMKAGTVNKLREQIVLSEDPQEAAEEALGLVAALGRHERLTRGHTERVRTYADMIGEELDLTQDERHKLRWGVLLHDVGKLGVPADILNKPGKPTDAEWATLKQHPAIGGKMLEPLSDWLGPWGLAAAEHHERWDGKGYPNGLAGEEISLAGRIAAVADAYDVITSKRSYKEKADPEEARRELVSCSGTQFDPAVVRAFLRVSLDDRRRTGWLGWLLEVPTLARLIASAGSAAAPAATAAAVTAAAFTGPAGMSPPSELAFVDDSPPAVVSELLPSTEVPGTTIPTTAVPTAVVSTTAAPTTVAPTTVASTTVAPTTTSTTTTVAPTTAAPATTTPPTTLAPTTVAPTTAAPTTTTTTTTTSTVPPVIGPTLMDDFAIVAAGDTQKLFVLANDTPGDGVFNNTTLRVISQSGAAEDVWLHEGHLHYVAGATQVGNDVIVYEVCNSSGACERATLTVTVYQQ